MTIGEVHSVSAFPGDYSGLLDRAAISAHLDHLSSLDKRGLMNTITPYNDLPPFDPAKFLIDYQQSQSGTPAETYTLGIVYARSLLREVLPDDYALPVVSGFDEESKAIVNRYMKSSHTIAVSQLVRDGSRVHSDLYKAALLFAGRCEIIAPHLMLDRPEELLRGCHDYLSVVSLLEHGPAEGNKYVMRQALGRLGLRGKAVSLWQAIATHRSHT